MYRIEVLSCTVYVRNAWRHAPETLRQLPPRNVFGHLPYDTTYSRKIAARQNIFPGHYGGLARLLASAPATSRW